MSKKTFMQGAVILGAAGVIIKIMGACFRIPLANLIGGEGMGYYQAVYPVYVLFLTIGTAGVPVAISRMVSERLAVGNDSGAYKVFRVSFILLACLGIVSFSICFFGAGWIVGMFENMDGAIYAMRAIAPALIFVPMMAAYRGYFQGMQNMKPTATSQIVEQLFRVVVGLLLAYFLIGMGTEFAAAGASFGATVGGIAGLLAVMIIYYRYKKKNGDQVNMRSVEKGLPDEPEDKTKAILVKLLAIAIPITIGAAIMPIMNAIDLAIVVNRLAESGWSAVEARSLYGQLTGFAGPLINLPQVLTQAVAMSLVPTITAAFKTKDTEFLHHNVQLGLRTSIMVGLPCAFGMMTLAEPIMLLIYPAQKADATSAASALFILAFGIIFLSSIQTLTGVLQGVGKQMIPVRNLFIGALVKIVITYTLTGIPEINVKGAAIGTVAAYIVAALLNIVAVKKYTGTKFNIGLTYVKPAIAALAMSLAAFITYRLISIIFGNAISTLTAVGVAGIVYVVMIFITKSITEEELALLPKGEKLIGLFRKFKKNDENKDG